MDAKKFLSLSDEELSRAFDKPIGICAYSQCKKEVRSLQEYQIVPAGIYHEDCYWDELGDEIEKNPICNPSRMGIGRCSLNKNYLGEAL